jgi:transmembrane protein TMEM43
LLFWNEGRAVQAYMGLAEGKSSVVSVPADKVDPSNDKKLVYLTGKATTEDNVTDADFGIEKKAIRLERQAEIYQWEEKFKTETVKKIGGGTQEKKTPVYEKIWSSSPIDSSQFKDPSKKNTGTVDFGSQKTTAAKVTLGAFTLSPEVVSRIKTAETLSATTIGLDAAKPEVKQNWKIAGEYFYRGGDSGSPSIGDQRIKYLLTLPQDVSLYAEQVGNTFAAYKTKAKTELLRLEPGTVPVAKMFDDAQSEEDTFTWILRLVGFVLMAVGVYLMFQPFVVFADVLPFLGNFLSMGIGLFAALVAVPLTLLTIAIAWIYYRPVLGVSLLVGVAFFVGLLFYFRRPRSSRIATAPTQPS